MAKVAQRALEALWKSTAGSCLLFFIVVLVVYGAVIGIGYFIYYLFGG